MFVHIVTYPIRVTFHVMCAMANYWLDVPDTALPPEWPDDAP